MPISETQLQTWTHAPASTKIQFTHEQVRTAIENSAILKDKCEIYLQGSYANSTNIKSEGDVDIVVQLNFTCNYDLSALPLPQRLPLFSSISAPTYNWPEFKQDVINALNKYFGTNAVKIGNKSIKLLGNDRRINADIIPCIKNLKYINQSEYIEGIQFWTTKEGTQIVNFPKIHLLMGEDKNRQHRTNTKYKHAVRMLKNIKQQIVEKYRFDASKAPSYFIESAIYNVPDDHFKSSYQETFAYAVDWILNKCNPTNMTTVSHQHLLFGTEPWQWSAQHASEFFNAAANYYLNNQ